MTSTSPNDSSRATALVPTPETTFAESRKLISAGGIRFAAQIVITMIAAKYPLPETTAVGNVETTFSVSGNDPKDAPKYASDIVLIKIDPSTDASASPTGL